MYKPKRFLITLLIFFSLFSIYAKPLAEKPDWIENWRTIYPDSVYIAQLGKATGKNGNTEIKTIATNMIAQYIKTNVQSQLSSSMETKTSITSEGQIKTSTERTNSQDITLSVDINLTSLEFTEPWYNKKEKTWYCLAYVERKKIWEQYRPNIQNARNKLFSFYEAAEKTSEPLYKMLLYTQSKDYEENFFIAYSFANILSSSLTKENYAHDADIISSVTAKITEEKNKATFALKISGDKKNIAYQSLKEIFSNEGYVVKNQDEDALYNVYATIHLDDMPVQSLHVICPSVEITIEGKTVSVFSYAKQLQNFSGLNEDIVQSKAVKALAEEIQKSFINEFNEKLNQNSLNNLFNIL